MTYLSRLVAAAMLFATAAPAAAWTGPQVSITNKNGRRVIQICDQGGGCTTSTPFFLALNSQNDAVANHDWSLFLYEAGLLTRYVSASTNGVVPILQVHLLSTSNAFLDELAGKLQTLSPRPYLYLRFYLETPIGASYARNKIANLQGQVHDDTGAQGAPYALSEAWLAYQETEIARVLARIDAMYPGRVVGVNIAYDNGGEWFFRPTGYDAGQSRMIDWGADDLCATSGGVTKCNLYPWANDAGAQAGPIGRHQFYLSDYSSTTETGFCAWSALPSSLSTGCRAATVVERNNATPGLALPTLGAARGVFLDPADLGSLRAAYYNRYVAEQNAAAIIRLLSRAKLASGSRILTSAFYGYLNGLGVEMATSGQTALTTLLASPAVDLVAGPYAYTAARALGAPYSPQGVPDAPGLANKLWFDEDDTRTHLAGGVWGQNVFTLWDSIRILRRNVLTAGLHNRGQWFLDLAATGWFGRPDMASDSEAMWANLVAAFAAVDKLQLSAPNRYNAQVAVFIDDRSPSYVAGLSPAGDASYALTSDLGSELIDRLGRLGTPVKQYLLSDLLRTNLDLSSVKLAIFANAWNVPANVRTAIDTKLRTPGRTLLFIYAAGYLQQDNPASVANIAALTGLSVALGTGSPALSQSFSVTGTTVLDGPDYALTPWFRVTDGAATALGSYRYTTGTSLARKSLAVSGGSYTSIVAAAPRLPLDVLRKLSEDAGVFHFTAKGDIVEAAGNMVMVHAATTGYKTIAFPQTLPRIFETALYPSDSLLCTSCAALTSQAFNAGDTRAFRWTSPPLGNFELISGTTVMGWAADFDVPSTPLTIQIYANGPLGAGSLLTSFTANTARPDLTAAFGIPGNHGFSTNLGSCPHGTALYAYALDPESSGDGTAFIGTHACP